MVHFEATVDFENAISEVDYLLEQSIANISSNDAQNALNKAAVLLLSAKMESFIEQIIEEYCYTLSCLNLPCEQIPTPLKIHATKRVLNADVLFALEKNNEVKIVDAMRSLIQLWHEGCSPESLAIDSTFTFV